MESGVLGPPVIVHLEPSEVKQLDKPVEGSGGFQSLLRRLNAQRADAILTLTPDIASRVARYYRQGYGSGGFQGRLRKLPSVVEAALQMVDAGQYLPFLLQVSEEEITDDLEISVEDSRTVEMSIPHPFAMRFPATVQTTQWTAWSSG